MDWQLHLKSLSEHLLGNLDDDELDELRDHENITNYLGRTAAEPKLIQDAEKRLGFMLPESLRNFYLASDGLRNADGFPIGIANILSVTEIFLLSECPMRGLDIYANYATRTFDVAYFSDPENSMENCVVIIDLDDNELGFAVRSDKMDDWPVVTYNPDGGDFELYSGFIDLMKDGLTY